MHDVIVRRARTHRFDERLGYATKKVQKGLVVLLVLLLSACSRYGVREQSSRFKARAPLAHSTKAEQRRLASALLFALDHVDPQRQMVLVARDEQRDRMQALAGERRVYSLTEFQRELAGKPRPTDVMLQVAELTPGGARIDLGIASLAPVPPGVLACGQHHHIELVREGRAWRVLRDSITVC